MNAKFRYLNNSLIKVKVIDFYNNVHQNKLIVNNY